MVIFLSKRIFEKLEYIEVFLLFINFYTLVHFCRFLEKPKTKLFITEIITIRYVYTIRQFEVSNHKREKLHLL